MPCRQTKNFGGSDEFFLFFLFFFLFYKRRRKESLEIMRFSPKLFISEKFATLLRNPDAGATLPILLRTLAGG
jgi:hypothetical protein